MKLPMHEALPDNRLLFFSDTKPTAENQAQAADARGNYIPSIAAAANSP